MNRTMSHYTRFFFFEGIPNMINKKCYRCILDNILLEIVRAPAVQPVSPPSRDELLDVEVGDEVSA